METADISYRVADFLRQHPPFHAVEDGDLLALTAQGRVRFHEPNEYILWQGEPHKSNIFVIQQGTVSLWDEAGERTELRDVRGAGDMLGIERYTDARSCLHSARSESDVVIYAFPASDFEEYILKYPHAARYIAAEGRVTTDYQPTGEQREPQEIFVHDIIGGKGVSACGAQDSLADGARKMLATGAGALAVLDTDHRVRAVLTTERILDWVANGGDDASKPIEHLLAGAPAFVGPRASVTDAVLAMGTADVDVVAVTADGTSAGNIQALATPRDLAPVFGEHPNTLLRHIRLAATVQELRELNNRSRAFALKSLTSATSVEWLARFTHLVDVAILARVVALGGGQTSGCWCFCGASGRGESLAKLCPHLLLILEDSVPRGQAQESFHRVLDILHQCDYLPRENLPRDTAFYVAEVGEWTERYRGWVTDAVLQQTHRVRSLFDLRPVHGRRSLWQEVEAAVMDSVERDFVQILAHDCLASLPPLTFFQDTVVDQVGEHSSTFRLEQSALRPLVDVGRVFGMAAKTSLERSTLQRFDAARALLPDHEATFREASDTLKIVLWLQGRVGIGLGTRGSDLPPALLSRHDRHVLKGGFRSILRLLEFTADRKWLENL